jgi:hypothetical protein
MRCPAGSEASAAKVLQLVRAAGSQVTETIMRIDRPWFVLEGAFLCDGASSRPRGIITGGQAGKTGRAVAIRYGEAVTALALIALLRQVIASDGVGGWRELSDMQMGRGWTPDSAVFRAGDRPDECREPVPVGLCVGGAGDERGNPFATLSSASGARPGGGAMSWRGDQAPPWAMAFC